MPNNSTKIMFYMSLVGGIILTISSNSWMGAWMGLEINLLSFIPIMTNNENLFTTEASMKYFLIQALASSILLFVILTSTIMEKYQLINKLSMHEEFMMIPLLLKSGVAPLHWWFPAVMEGMSWINCLILMTLQKISPMILMSNIITSSIFMMSTILLSVLVGSLGGLNQISLRKMLTYSSINHVGWLMASLLISNNMWMIYFLIYSMLTTTIIFITNSKKISLINQTFNLNNESTIKLLMFMSLLSLGGLPPFTGFLSKWMVIHFLVYNNLIIPTTMMIIFSLITLYYYLRISYAAFMLNHLKPSWNFKSFNSGIMSSTLVTISIMGLTIMSLPISIYL
uniref:NADH dehydrogenase subunit 2 n=1 Tax=Balta curvirostris TaxID=3037034 RepID=UPI00257C7192|nr:NADH dehydrogenase subunit 2 [Balta curvirostris]WGW15117.1 NADH dehydrogenase subunit 2 [Balta curvirostris]